MTGGHRRALLAKVHIAAKQMGLDRDAYGDVLARVTGRRGAGTLDDGQLGAVLEEFKRLGWQGRVPRPLPGKPAVRMIYGLWKDLRPHLADPSKDALRAFVARQTVSALHPLGVGAPEFLDGKQASVVIEALKGWLARERRRAAAGNETAVDGEAGDA